MRSIVELIFSIWCAIGFAHSNTTLLRSKVNTKQKTTNNSRHIILRLFGKSVSKQSNISNMYDYYSVLSLLIVSYSVLDPRNLFSAYCHFSRDTQQQRSNSPTTFVASTHYATSAKQSICHVIKHHSRRGWSSVISWGSYQMTRGRYLQGTLTCKYQPSAITIL